MISGGVKFFERPVSIFADGNTTISASSGNSGANRMLDQNRVTYWRSVGSDDTTTETITITFISQVTFSRLFLVDHNFKSYNVKYYNGASYVHFASVVGIDGSMSNITETTFADDTAYYEFTPVTTGSIQIQVTTTQVADEEKYLNLLVCTTELGTLQGYPDIKGLSFARNEKSKKMLSGKQLTLKSQETFKCALQFRNYPGSLSADVDLMFELFDIETTFLIWVCGGRRGASYFKKQLRGWRLRDLFTVQTIGQIDPDYRDNVYLNPVNFTINFVESVD